MKWFSFLVKAVVLFLVVWAVFGIGAWYGFLEASVVPEKGVKLSDWAADYYMAGLVSAFLGLLMSALWFFQGINYAGGEGIGLKHALFWGLSLVFGFLAAFFLLPAAQDGAFFALFTVWLIAPIGYYLNSLFNSAEAVKFIPPLGDKFHK